MFDQLPRDKRHAAGRIDLLPFDNFHRPDRVPFVQEDHLVARVDGRHHGRGTGCAVEHWHDRQPDPDRRFGKSVPPPQCLSGCGIADCNCIGCQIAMRTERTLGLPGRAAGIENGRWIIRRNACGREILVRQIGIIVGTANNIFKGTGRRCQLALAACHDDMFQICQIGKMRRNPVPSFGIAEQHAGLGILQSENQFLVGPPCVERHGDRPDRRRGKENHRPFRQIAHRQRNPVPLGYADSLQFHGKGGDRAIPVGIGDAFVFKNQKFAIAMATRMFR